MSDLNNSYLQWKASFSSQATERAIVWTEWEGGRGRGSPGAPAWKGSLLGKRRSLFGLNTDHGIQGTL